MNAVKLAAAVAAALCLSGCASIVKGSTQQIAITTPPVEGADCTLTNPRGSWSVVSPGTVEVKRSKANIDIVCTKAGYRKAKGFIPSDFENWTVGNAVMGGLVGITVDAATGAANQYPSAFAVPMTPDDTAAVAPPKPAAAPAAAPATGAAATPAPVSAPAAAVTPTATPAATPPASPATPTVDTPKTGAKS